MSRLLFSVVGGLVLYFGAGWLFKQQVDKATDARLAEMSFTKAGILVDAGPLPLKDRVYLLFSNGTCDLRWWDWSEHVEANRPYLFEMLPACKRPNVIKRLEWSQLQERIRSAESFLQNSVYCRYDGMVDDGTGKIQLSGCMDFNGGLSNLLVVETAQMVLANGGDPAVDLEQGSNYGFLYRRLVWEEDKGYRYFDDWWDGELVSASPGAE